MRGHIIWDQHSETTLNVPPRDLFAYLLFLEQESGKWTEDGGRNLDA